MNDTKRLKIIYEMIGELLDNNAERQEPVIVEKKRRGIYDHQITSGVTDEMYERINDHCQKKGICKAELIRNAVSFYLALVYDQSMSELNLNRILSANTSHA